jgi:hypothetical protein
MNNEYGKTIIEAIQVELSGNSGDFSKVLDFLNGSKADAIAVF